MNQRSVQNTISIRNIIIIVFITIMLTTVSAIGYIVFSKWLASADEMIKQLAEDMNAQIFSQVDSFAHNPQHINAANRLLIENGIIDLTNEIEREKFFVGVLESQSGEPVYSFSYGTENGEYYGARRNENNEIEIMRNNAATNGFSWYYSVKDDMTAGDLVVRAGKFDARTRDWYKAAKASQQPVFSPIYKHFVMNDLTVSAAYPIYGQDRELKGVLGTHIILSNIDNYLKKIVQDPGGFAVILEKDSGALIANSFDMANFTTRADGTFKRLSINETENQSVLQAYQRYMAAGENTFRLNSENDRWYINLTEYHDNGLNWLVITGIPESLFKAGIVANMKLTLLLAWLAVMLSIAVYLGLTKKLIKPLDGLIDTTEKFAQGDLSLRVKVIRNDEIGRIAETFNNMAETIYMLVHNLDAKVQERTAELESTNRELKENKDQLQLILDSTAEAIYGIDNKGNCTFCNASCVEMLGYKHQDELIGKNMHFQIHHSRRDGTSMPLDECKMFKALKAGKGVNADDELFWRADHTSFDVEYHSYPQYKNGEIIGAVVTFMDNTERKENEEHIKYLGSHDALTGLYNRRYFTDELKKIDTKKNLPISIIFGDINGLKLTNDVFGHAAGDALISKCAEIMNLACREEDIVARVGGDEFVILLPNREVSDARKIITRIKNELAKEQIAAIKCSMSMGCYMKTSANQDIMITMENAENEMYKEKTLNRKDLSSDMINAIMATLHNKSPREKQHSLNVGQLCQKIGTAMNWPEIEVAKLKEAGFLHDIGKAIIDANIINKAGLLTEAETREMRQHPVVSYRILNLFDDTKDFAEGVYSHHENWDGSGYPEGLKGEEIPELARIIAVAERYDAMTNPGAMNILSKAEALQEINKMAGTLLDPKIAGVFVKIMTHG